LEQDARNAVNDIKDFLPLIPQLNLLRIGYLF
jgi:hypothetical protein